MDQKARWRLCTSPRGQEVQVKVNQWASHCSCFPSHVSQLLVFRKKNQRSFLTGQRWTKVLPSLGKCLHDGYVKMLIYPTRNSHFGF